MRASYWQARGRNGLDREQGRAPVDEENLSRDGSACHGGPHATYERGFEGLEWFERERSRKGLKGSEGRPRMEKERWRGEGGPTTDRQRVFP
jgi:hypothetical protein